MLIRAIYTYPALLIALEIPFDRARAPALLESATDPTTVGCGKVSAANNVLRTTNRTPFALIGRWTLRTAAAKKRSLCVYNSARGERNSFVNDRSKGVRVKSSQTLWDRAQTPEGRKRRKCEKGRGCVQAIIGWGKYVACCFICEDPWIVVSKCAMMIRRVYMEFESNPSFGCCAKSEVYSWCFYRTGIIRI